MKRNGIISSCFLAAAGLLFSSCSSLYYAPNQPVMPMVTEKGVTKIGTSFGGGNYSSAFDMNGFHSLTSHVGIYGNYSLLLLDLNEFSCFDFGAGYFAPVNSSFGFEAYGTIGYGSLSLYYYDIWSGTDQLHHGANAFRLAVTPDIFFKTPHFEAGFGCRLHYFEFDKQPVSPDFFGTTTNHLMLEPTLRMAFGWPVFKFSLQGTWTDKINSGYLNYDTYMISMGIMVTLVPKKK